jgi:cyclase
MSALFERSRSAVRFVRRSAWPANWPSHSRRWLAALSIVSVPFAFPPVRAFAFSNGRKKPVAHLAAVETPAPLPTGPAVGLTRLQIKPNLYFVVGGGSNSAFLVTPAGVVLVGAKESEQAGQELRDVIAGVTDQPVRYLIHPNHQARYTHGSTAFPQAVEIIAHEKARQYMQQPPEANYWTGLAAPSLPDLAVRDRLTLYLGGTRVEVIHPGRGHTDGDLVILFPDQRAVHTGDLFWNRRLPFIDRAHGGSAAALIASDQRVLALPGVDTVIPGYGDVGTRADMLTQVSILRDLQSKLRALKARGRTRAQAISDIPIPSFARSDPLERFEALLGALYDDLKK